MKKKKLINIPEVELGMSELMSFASHIVNSNLFLNPFNFRVIFISNIGKEEHTMSAKVFDLQVSKKRIFSNYTSNVQFFTSFD